MKTKLLLSALFTFVFCLLSSQIPQGFNYQAVARDGSGTLLTNQPLNVKIDIQTSLSGGTIIWEETHSVTTDKFGVMVLVIGKGTRQAGSALLFTAINWSSQTLYLKTSIQYPGPAWLDMGSTQLWSVPYSLVSSNLGGPVKNLSVKGETTSFDEALFEVKNNTGQTVFAVYNEGIRAYVDNGKLTKGAKGGFAIGGFGTTKTGESQNLMMISPDSARIYVDETAAKGSKGGFAIGGFNLNKGTIKEFMLLTPANYFIGHNSGQAISTGLYNSTLGYESGKGLTEGSNNVLIGYQSGIGTVGGGSNVFIGTQTGYTNTSGNYNIVLGRQAGYYNTASSNIFLGDLTAYWNTSGDQNVMIGDWAGYHNTEGFQNVFLGAEAGWFNTTGSNNIFMGFESGYHNDSGNDNIAIGNKAGTSNLTGTYNVMIGSDAGYTNQSGDYNTIIGYKAGEKTTSDYGTMLGYLAGNSNTTGYSQTMLGYMAGSLNTGGFNTYVGTYAGGNNASGDFNTYLGIAAGKDAPGSNNVFIGKWAGWSEAGSDKLIIENNYSDPDNMNNALIYGDFANNYLKVNGEILSSVSKLSGYAADFKNTGGAASYYGVNISAGTLDGSGQYNYLIDFNSGSGAWKGSIMIKDGVVGLYQSSDSRLKENITKSGIDALNILNEMQVVDFNYTKSPGAKHTGYIAQDVQHAFPDMVIYNEKADVYAISTAALIPVLHKAIQEQQVLIQQQKEELDLLKTELEQIKTLLSKSGIK